jgi:chemotaxis protein CheD
VPEALRRIRSGQVLHPGDFQVAEGTTTLSTLLGSCVAVCLYDPVRKLIGMNHFLLAYRRYSSNIPVLESEAGRYGIHAMELLINAMLGKGCARDRLQAKAFGGGNVLPAADSLQCVGSMNTRFVITFLEQDGIPLVAADLGGNFGRQINFSGDDFSVLVRRIPGSQTANLAAQERLYWRQVVEGADAGDQKAYFW